MTERSKYDELVARLEYSGNSVTVPHDPELAAELLAFDLEQARGAELEAKARGHAPRPAGVPELAAGYDGSTA